MESVLGYILIIILVIVSVYFYNLRKKTSRTFTLSQQNYADAVFKVRVIKEKGTITKLILALESKKDLDITSISVELITRKREFNSYDLCDVFIDIKVPFLVNSNEAYNVELDFEKFKKLLADGDLPFRTFRFVVKAKNNTAYKSHELGFNKRWVIYRPDSGTYN